MYQHFRILYILTSSPQQFILALLNKKIVQIVYKIVQFPVSKGQVKKLKPVFWPKFPSWKSSLKKSLFFLLPLAGILPSYIKSILWALIFFEGAIQATTEHCLCRALAVNLSNQTQQNNQGQAEDGDNDG